MASVAANFARGARAGDRLRLPTRRRGGSRKARSRVAIWSKNGSQRGAVTRCIRPGRSADESALFVLWWQLPHEMRPIALDDTAHLIVDRGDLVHGFDLLADEFEFLRAELAAEHKLDGHHDLSNSSASVACLSGVSVSRPTGQNLQFEGLH